MSAYNIQKKTDRDRLRRERQDELQAIQNGTWPRDSDEFHRWNIAGKNLSEAVKYARRMCAAELDYLDDLERRLRDGDKSLEGWER